MRTPLLPRCSNLKRVPTPLPEWIGQKVQTFSRPLTLSHPKRIKSRNSGREKTKRETDHLPTHVCNYPKPWLFQQILVEIGMCPNRAAPRLFPVGSLKSMGKRAHSKTHTQTLVQHPNYRGCFFCFLFFHRSLSTLFTPKPLQSLARLVPKNDGVPRWLP